MKKIIFTFVFLSAFSACFAQSSGAVAYYEATYHPILKSTAYGKIVLKGTRNPPVSIAGKTSSDYVHIFVDEYGNLVGDNLPNGVAWVYYVIHVIHPTVARESYGIVQTSGSISGSFVVQNAAPAAAPAPGPHGAAVPPPVYTEDVSALSPSDNSNIAFQVIKTTVDAAGTATKSTIASYTLIMSGFFNASIDVGVINSKLHNPTYSFVNSPVTAGNMVVKAADAGDRTMTTVMGTIYFSPIVWFERLVDKDNVPLFKVKGRSSIEDHKLFERIYPTFGLSINDNSFQNIFYGVNWEIIRGGSLFLGFHSGKINTYTSSTPGFVFGSTAVTQDQFNYSTDTKWATKFAIGATIDLRVVLGLLSTQIK